MITASMMISASTQAEQFLARRQATLDQVAHGPASAPDFLPWVILIAAIVIGVNAYKARRKADDGERKLYNDLRRFDAEKLRAEDDRARLLAELEQAKHVIAVMRSGGYVAPEDVPKEVPTVQEVWAQPVPQAQPQPQVQAQVQDPPAQPPVQPEMEREMDPGDATMVAFLEEEERRAAAERDGR